MKLRLLLTALLFFTFSAINLKANNLPEELGEHAQISILTNDPWEKEVYSLFGHTVIRVKDPLNKIDLAFNYGVFDFDSPNFTWRFMTGATDYMVVGYDMNLYFYEYQIRKVQVHEQLLNLTQQEKQNIWEALRFNIRPENCVYRYNFLYDNCATRPRDIIEQNIEGKINYTPTGKEQTYRDLIHECVNVKPWLRFGIDLVIGSDADKIITDRQKDFLPRYLKNAYHGATIEKNDGSKLQFVVNERILIPGESAQESMTTKPVNTPFHTGIILLGLTLLISCFTYKKKLKTLGKVYGNIIFLIAGFFGGIIFFLMYFSEHPCVNPNWNLIWLNPLQLIVGCLFFVKPLQKYIYYYHFINFAALLLFILLWYFIPQQLEVAFIPYILTIMLVSGTNIVTKITAK